MNDTAHGIFVAFGHHIGLLEDPATGAHIVHGVDHLIELNLLAILTAEQAQALEGKVSYEVWSRLDDGRMVTRFASSWATPREHIDYLATLLK